MSRHHRLWLAWGLVGVLLAFLALREGLGVWREWAQWRGLAESVAGLREGPSLSLERLRQSAQARHIDLVEVQPDGARWRLRGKVAEAQVLQEWLQALREDGAQPLQWGLMRDEDGLRFDVQVLP
ncbi:MULTISPECIES: type II secretion system protein GspM [unclassified Pseudomonas]|uniref:type II secretion system protein GspM n=1 Tax=unclassified Pseudomonas TaxID=196821 RepID=UPI002447780E|nr:MULTISPECIES: type II secretion system protein GspM [unclassified Pseudomonas]MDH0304958.1 type II secretion system protein GspM [Pseudomonas sp. GD04091]MDH1987559.1 type II secretion system protein GspM [Pseudomonas sp. GD03689]